METVKIMVEIPKEIYEKNKEYTLSNNDISIISNAIRNGTFSKNDEYENGLWDAWECARKIIHMTDEEKDDCFGVIGEACYFDLSTPSECISKIKEYEEKTQIN